MLRCIYLLSFLICIELTVCYNYMDVEVNERSVNKIGRNFRRDRDRKLRKPKQRRNLQRQEYDYDKSPVEFDVASFIQPEEENLEEDGVYRHRNKKRSRIQKPYDFGPSANYAAILPISDDKKKEKSPDYLNLVPDYHPDLSLTQPIFKDALNAKHINYNGLDEIHSDKYSHEKFRNIYKEDFLFDQNAIAAHAHEKKCTLKRMKFPFFSHNKSDTAKPKKNKKRKLFCFNCSSKEGVKVPEEMKVTEDPLMQYKIKRSYEERLCPACKKLFVMANLPEHVRHKKTPKRVIKRKQFYAPNNQQAVVKDNRKVVRKPNTGYAEEDDAVYRNSRDKRENARERQLKELEEVQRKVDSVEINVPTFEAKPAEATN